MTDLSASERRLITALERIDYIVERAAADLVRARTGPAEDRADEPDDDHAAGPDATAQLAALQDENRQLGDELALLRAGQDDALADLRQQLAEATDRLSNAGAAAARLAASNDALTAANRALIDAAADWAGRGEDAVRAALEAEVESLRATRAVEFGQMAEILDALDGMLGADAADAAPPAPDASPDEARDGARDSVRDGGRARPADDMSLFGAVYADDPDDDPTEERG